MQKFQSTNGKKFDDWQVTCLVTFIKQQQQDKKHDPQGFIAELYNIFLANCKQNNFYKKTPKVFTNPTVFFVQAHNAIRQVFPDVYSEDALRFIYQRAVLIPIGCMPDVSMSEAGRILKQTKNYKRHD